MSEYGVCTMNDNQDGFQNEFPLFSRSTTVLVMQARSMSDLTLFDVAIFITPVFRPHWRYWFQRANEIIETHLRGCNKKAIIWPRCASRSYWHWLAI